MADRPFPLQFEALTRRRHEIAFLIDFDGTMVDFATHPDDICVPSGLPQAIRAIAAKTDLAFAVVTGRMLGKLDTFMEGATTAAIGSHGAEWRSKPFAEKEFLVPPIPFQIRDAFESIGEKHGCIVENKIFTLSLHLPFERQDMDLMPELTAVSGSGRYLFHKVGRTYEITQQSVNKGSGILHLLDQPPFAGRQPVYIGDDVHTEESLQVVLDRNGLLLAMPEHVPLQGSEHKHDDIETADVRALLTQLAQ